MGHSPTPHPAGPLSIAPLVTYVVGAGCSGYVLTVRKYTLVGAPGSGKSTHGVLLARDFDLVRISVGDIFRWHVVHHTKIGARVREDMAAGRLIGDAVVEAVMRDRLEQHDWNHGFVIDGFPRNRTQAEFFLERYDLDAVIHLDTPDSQIRDRVLSRRTVTREDDTPEALTTRLRDYRRDIAPVLELLRRKAPVFVVDASRDPDTVQDEIRTRLGLRSPQTPGDGSAARDDG